MWSGVEKFMFCVDDGIRLQLTGFPCTLTFNNNSDLRMSNLLAYPPLRRLLLQGFWETRAFQLFLTNHTWAFPRYQTNNRKVSTRRMHDDWLNMKTKIPWDVCYKMTHKFSCSLGSISSRFGSAVVLLPTTAGSPVRSACPWRHIRVLCKLPHAG